MAEKTLNTRIKNKIDTATNWAKATTFVPLSGEIILYSDTNKIKIGDGTTTLSALDYANITEDDIGEGELIDINDGTLTLQVAGNTKATFTANQSSDTTFNVTAADLGLTGALKFIGISTTNPTGSGATVSGHTTWSKGDVVLYQKSGLSYYNEYVLTADENIASNWEELGAEGSYALKSTTITGTGILQGGGSLESNREITHATGSAASVTSGLYKFSTDAYSHIASATAVTKSDITGLGIPASDTNQTVKVAGETFGTDAAVNFVAGSNVTLTKGTNQITIGATDTVTTVTTSGSGNVVTGITASNGQLTVTKGSLGDGTVTSVAVKMNDTVKGTVTTSGTIDLGTVVTDVSTKEDTTNKVTSILSSSTDTQYPSAKAVYTEISALSSAKVNVAQGSANVGKFLIVGSDGNVTLQAFETLAGGSY